MSTLLIQHHLYLNHIQSEINGAKEYAKFYISYRAKGKTKLANHYKEMCADELRHAKYIYEEALECLEPTASEPITEMYAPSVLSVKYMLEY